VLLRLLVSRGIIFTGTAINEVTMEKRKAVNKTAFLLQDFLRG
jgi:hypothetical protein